MSTHEPADTIKIVTPAASSGTIPPRSSSSLVEIDVWGQSDTGRVRPQNEDHFLIARFGRFLESVQTNLPSRTIPSFSEETGYAMLVADGMGGHAGGDIASQLVITTLVNLALTTPDWILRLSDDDMVNEVIRRARERVEQVNRVLTEQAVADPRLRKLGSTMTLALSLGKDLFVAHIGDSRVYILRNQQLQQLTHDHTFLQQLADTGVHIPAEHPVHRLRHVLTRSLGAGKHDDIDVRKFTLEDNDCLLLCSDGLTEMVPTEVIAKTLQMGGAESVCRRLVDLALEAGGNDNITVIVARFKLPAV